TLARRDRMCSSSQTQPRWKSGSCVRPSRTLRSRSWRLSFVESNMVIECMAGAGGYLAAPLFPPGAFATATSQAGDAGEPLQDGPERAAGQRESGSVFFCPGRLSGMPLASPAKARNFAAEPRRARRKAPGLLPARDAAPGLLGAFAGMRATVSAYRP